MTNESRLLIALSVSAPNKAAAKVRKAIREEGSIVAAAKSLGVSRSLLYRLMGELGVSLERVVR